MVGAYLTSPNLHGFVAGPAIVVASVFGGMWIGSLIAFRLGRATFEGDLHKVKWMQVVNGSG